MSTSFEIYSKVTDYLERRSSLADLEAWITTRLPVYLDNPDSAGGKLAVLVELCLAEYYDGLRAKRGVRSVLAKYTSNHRLNWFEYPETQSSNLTSTATATNQVLGLSWVDPSLSLSIGPATVSA